MKFFLLWNSDVCDVFFVTNQILWKKELRKRMSGIPQHKRLANNSSVSQSPGCWRELEQKTVFWLRFWLLERQRRWRTSSRRIKKVRMERTDSELTVLPLKRQKETCWSGDWICWPCVSKALGGVFTSFGFCVKLARQRIKVPHLKCYGWKPQGNWPCACQICMVRCPQRVSVPNPI